MKTITLLFKIVKIWIFLSSKIVKVWLLSCYLKPSENGYLASWIMFRGIYETCLRLFWCTFHQFYQLVDNIYEKLWWCAIFCLKEISLLSDRQFNKTLIVLGMIAS